MKYCGGAGIFAGNGGTLATIAQSAGSFSDFHDEPGVNAAGIDELGDVVFEA